MCRDKTERSFHKAKLYEVYADSKEERFPAEKYLIRICCGLAEILHRGGLVDRAGLPSEGRTERL
jgi:hypothetical protein